MATNNFKPFATGTGANVTSQADYEALTALLTGFQAGKASSAQINKAIRQATFVAAALAQYMTNKTGQDVLDNGDINAFITKMAAAFGHDFQALDAGLTSLAGLVGAADTLPYFSGVDTFSLTALTAAGRGLISQTSIANALNYLQGAPINSPAFTGAPTAPTAAAATNNTQIATTAFAQALITALIGDAPAGLNTLNKIAVAINNDPAFSNNIINTLNKKAPLANPTFTGTVTAPVVNTGDFSSTGTANVATFNGQTVNSTVSATFAGSVLFSGQDYLNKNSVVYVSADNSNQTLGLRLTGSGGQRSDELFYEKIGTYAARRFVVISGGNTITFDMRQDGSMVCLNPTGNWQIYPDGNISGTRWGGYLFDYINNQISSQISALNTSLRTWAASQFPSITYVNQTFMQDSRLGSPTTLSKVASTNVFTCPSGYTFVSIDTGDVGTVTATARPIQKYINGNWITVSQL